MVMPFVLNRGPKACERIRSHDALRCAAMGMPGRQDMKPESGDVSHLDLAGRMRPPDPNAAAAASRPPCLPPYRPLAIAIMTDGAAPAGLLVFSMLLLAV